MSDIFAETHSLTLNGGVSGEVMLGLQRIVYVSFTSISLKKSCIELQLYVNFSKVTLAYV